MRNVFIFKTSFLQLIYESFYGQKWWKWKPSSSDVTGGCSFLRELQNLKKVFSRVGADFCRYLGKYCFVFVPVKRRVLLETRATTYVERKIHWTTPLTKEIPHNITKFQLSTMNISCWKDILIVTRFEQKWTKTKKIRNICVFHHTVLQRNFLTNGLALFRSFFRMLDQGSLP